MTTDTYTTPGAGSWLCPAGVTSIQVDAIGASGGGWRGNGSSKGAGSAGAPAVQLAAFTTIPGNTYNFVVGALGVGATASVAAVVGGDTTFNGGTLIAKGGKAATGTNGPGIGQTTSCVGDTKVAGTSGINGASGGAGGNAASIGVLTGGTGNTGTGAGLAGASGTAPGGGASGGGNGATLVGGDGVDGALAITYTIPPPPPPSAGSAFFALL